MSSELLYQVRVAVSAEMSEALRADPACESYPELGSILRKHNATLKCQYDAFADYVNEAERMGTQNYPLYQWTRDTIENPAKKAKYLLSFTVYVNGDQIYAKAIADDMEAELLKRVDGKSMTSVAKYDTNPANNPQPPKR